MKEITDEFHGMDPRRWLMLDDVKEELTDDELEAGWHRCPTLGDILIHRSDPEAAACRCGKIKRIV